MDMHLLDDSAIELTCWLTHRGGYLFEERPQALHQATVDLYDDGADEEISADGFED